MRVEDTTNRAEKLEIARVLLSMRYDNGWLYGPRKVRRLLITRFGSGISPNELVAMQAEIRGKSMNVNILNSIPKEQLERAASLLLQRLLKENEHVENP